MYCRARKPATNTAYVYLVVFPPRQTLQGSLCFHNSCTPGSWWSFLHPACTLTSHKIPSSCRQKQSSSPGVLGDMLLWSPGPSWPLGIGGGLKAAPPHPYCLPPPEPFSHCSLQANGEAREPHDAQLGACPGGYGGDEEGSTGIC